MASSTVSTSTHSTGIRKAHNRRESTGHICTACDQCYRCKVRCSGERPVCERCRSQSSACTYSTGKPLGKPKGSKNKIQRSKSTSEVLPKLPIAPADNAINPDWSQLSPTKRPNDGDLPPSKRTNVDLSAPEAFPPPSVLSGILDAADITSVLLKHEPTSAVMEDGTSYVDDSNVPLTHGEHRDGPKTVHEAFPSAELNLEIDDFDWFTLIGGTPAAAPVEPSATALDSVRSISAAPAVQPPPLSSGSTLDQPESSGSSVSSDKSDILPRSQMPASQGAHLESFGCLCDPLSLGIISELHNLQLSFSPLDTALILARRGLSTVSSYLSCPSCLSRLSNSPSLFLACVLILQQVFACYITVRLQGTKLLIESEMEKKKGHSAVSIGDFEVEGEESCNGVLDAIVKAEMEKGRGIIGGLENCIEKVGSHGKDRVAGVLLRALREEIGWETAAC